MTYLTEERTMIQRLAREFSMKEVLPVANELDPKKEDMPMSLRNQMGELGFYGANLPEEYGCAGLNNVAYGLIMQELEAGDSGVRSMASVQTSLVMFPIHEFGSEEQKMKYLPRLASGEIIELANGFIHYKAVKYGIIERLLEWHFDIFGLIEKGLAIDINTL